MGELQRKLLQACTLRKGGVTGVTGVTAGLVTPEKASSYYGYGGYASESANLSTDKPKGVTGADGQRWDALDWRSYFEERAAMREHEGGLARREAETLAIEDTIIHWLSLHPAPASDFGEGCVRCSSGDQVGNTLLPVLAPGGHVWVHDRCWEAWHGARRQAAQLALQGLGLTLAAYQVAGRSERETRSLHHAS